MDNGSDKRLQAMGFRRITPDHIRIGVLKTIITFREWHFNSSIGFCQSDGAIFHNTSQNHPRATISINHQPTTREQLSNHDCLLPIAHSQLVGVL